MSDSPSDQPSRDDIVFEPKDEPLRDDVRVLGALLGQVITEQGGAALFDRVETARQAARRRRRGDPLAGEDLAGTLGNLPPAEAEQVVRAFSAYFNLVNMAEQVHRLRRRREYAHQGGVQPAGFEWVLRQLQSRGIPLEDVQRHIANLRVEPVFTAHPTEAVRRTLLAKQQRIAAHLIRGIDADCLTPAERDELRDAIRHEVTTAWQTDEHLEDKPTVADELEHILFYVSEVIVDVVPQVKQALLRALEATYGSADVSLVHDIIGFGSWVGGDMDGNPAVGADTIRASLARHRELVLRHYRDNVRRLFDQLSHSEPRVRVAPPVQERIAAYRQLFPEESGRIPPRYHNMPYRELLWLMQARIDATLASADNADGAYRDARELHGDLAAIGESLTSHGAGSAADRLVQPFVERVNTFGFHLATLDVRQDAEVHRRVAGVLLGDAQFASRPAAERARLLTAALTDAATLPVEQWPDNAEVRATLDVMRAIGDSRRTYGGRAIGPYIISMAQGADDALALLYLAVRGGLRNAHGDVELEVAPLFETVDDLAAGPGVLQQLLGDARYRAHVAAYGNRQTVMLGYSDSNKDSGIAASRQALYEAQEQLVAVADAAGVDVVLFHGRGGTTSRGGGKVRDAVLAQPPSAVRDRLRITEQGEIIHAKYGIAGIAERTFELMIGAVLQASATEPLATAPDTAWRDAMRMVADESRRAYRALVIDDPDLFAYFRLATPLDAIERLQIGSRPASRRKKEGIKDLRAIPWVFSWTQSRHILPGWYGLGSGLQAAREKFGAELLREMAAAWPVFGTLLADAEMVLAKADMPIALRYSRLAGDVGQRVYPRILAEFERTRATICDARQQTDLLDRDPVLRRAIRLRNPYIDPMSLLQIDLLRRWRAADRNDDDLERALFTTVKGIARGLQNTG